MVYYTVKLLLSAAIIVTVSEVAKRSAALGGLVASLPLISYLGIIWLYADTRDAQKVADLSWSILWLVLPSLPFFIVLPLLLKRIAFVPSLLAATGVMFIGYGLTLLIIRRVAAP